MNGLVQLFSNRLVLFLLSILKSLQYLLFLQTFIIFANKHQINLIILYQLCKCNSQNFILFKINLEKKLAMYSTQKPLDQNYFRHNQFEKVSLSKLAHLKLPIVNNTQINKRQYSKSHIVFIDQSQNFDIGRNFQATSSDLKINSNSKGHKRKKIFQDSTKSTRQDLKFPTFNKIAQSDNKNQQFKQNTQYYSMYQDFNSLINSNLDQTNKKRVTFADKQNNCYEKQSIPNLLIRTNEQLLRNLPLLEGRLQNHQDELKKIKKYLKANESIVLSENMKLAQENERLNRQRQLIQLRQFSLNRSEQQKQRDVRKDQTLQKIERERTSRILKIQKQNEMLKQALCFQTENQSHQYLQNGSQEYDINWSKSYPFDVSEEKYKQNNKQRHFRKPQNGILLSQFQYSNQHYDSCPNKDLKDKNQFIQPNYVYYEQKDQKIGQNISSVKKGFDSFSLDNNTTFREILSPLDFQKQSQSFW